MKRRDFLKGAAGMAGVAALAAVPFSAAKAEGEAIYKPGTYTATAVGLGTVTVTMTFDETSITDVQVDVSGESATRGAQLGGGLAGMIKMQQGTDLDIMANASITNKAVLRAANNCIAQAKGEAPVPEVAQTQNTGSYEDWLGMEPEIAEADIAETIDTDIVIVGAGNGGMAAAAYAAQNGLQFRVVEAYGCVQDTRHWYGAIDSKTGFDQGAVPMNKHKLLSEISRYASGKCDQRVVRTWINESAAMQDFIAGILENEPYNYKCKVTTGEAAHWPLSDENTTYFFPEQEHTYMGARKARNVVFQEYIEGLGYGIDFNRSLVKLEKDADGRVTGIIAESTEDGSYIRYNAAKGVLLACGGYPANPYMMEALDPLAVKVTTCYNYSPRDRGMGIRAAIWAGASLDKEAAPMLFDRGIVKPGVDAGYMDCPSAFGGKEFPGTVTQYFPGTQPFLKVNRRGERFANESSPYNDINYAAGNQPGGVYCQVHDANFFEDVTRFHTIGCSAGVQNPGMMENNLKQMEEQGLVMKADTLDELADKLGFEGEAKNTFLATIDRYNELYDKQDDEDFGKMKERLSAIRTAPFYGCWLGASLLTTLQGIAINEKAQALTEARDVIPGLYVTGDNSGSFFANNYPCLMPGLACGRTMCLGIKAIKTMGELE
ncbi:MAG: FAD-binding protein [Lachnospiraceae bacterium]|nr:FAD-binding protein [Lachnospiraceae bacterium]